MRVAFLTDPGNQDGTIGGAELTMQEFKDAAPDGTEFGENVRDDLDAVVLGNVVGFDTDLIPLLRGKPVTWFHNDLSPHINSGLKGWLDENAIHVFCSPLQRDRYGIDGSLVPPAIDLDRFKPTRQVRRNGDRKPLVSLGAWQNPGKGQQSLKEYADLHGTIDVYGTGQFAPTQPPLDFKGPVDPAKVPELLWGYERFVFLPWDVEPFGRSVVEAWAAGLEVVTNRLVGARYWLERAPERLATAAQDFWRVVLS